MGGLLDLLADAAPAPCRVRFLPEGTAVRYGEIWERSTRAGSWIASHVERGGAVAAVLVASPDCLATAVGAWRSGVTLASLPYPARGMGLDEYQAQIESMMALVGASVLFVEGSLRPLLPELPFAVTAFEECVQGDRGPCRDEPGELVQFTSGSTAEPKGVRLSLASVGGQVAAVLDLLELEPDDATCSWLPLSHDMGLIGMCLAAWAAAGSRWGATTGERLLIRPESFLTNPSVWLRSCAESGAAVVATPNFGLEMVLRRKGFAQGLDLGRLRVCLVGSDRVHPATLAAFAQEAAAAGFDSRAFSPAYGLAEATLAVTMVRPHEHWREVLLDDERGAVQLVACGRPLPNADVRIAEPNAAGLGEIEVKGEALLDGYVGADLELRPGGWFATGDLGLLDRDELVVVGRLDDQIVLGGKNFSALELAATAATHAAVRRGNVGVIEIGGQYVVVAEASATGDRTGQEAAARELQSSLVRRFGVGPAEVVFVPSGTLPKTPSGKIQRHRLLRLYESASLTVETSVRFGAGVRM